MGVYLFVNVFTYLPTSSTFFYLFFFESLSETLIDNELMNDNENMDR